VSELKVDNLHVSVAGNEILHGVNLAVQSGEVHALMGPNGSGKSTLSHALMGRGDYDVSQGSITIDGEELRGMPTWQRAQRGLFLAMQYPVAVPGVPLEHLVAASLRARNLDAAGLHDAVVSEGTALGVRAELLARGVNDEFSGGEQKRAETVQLAVLEPKFAILDEIDSGLDVDSLRVVSRRVEQMTQDKNLGVLAITHYVRVLRELRPDRVHVMLEGRVVLSGGPELADRLEETGYEGIAAEVAAGS
jgi:Fe-S cluster assembly ATP-binding protein